MLFQMKNLTLASRNSNVDVLGDYLEGQVLILLR